MAVEQKEIQIDTYRKTSSMTFSDIRVSITVTEEKHWDKLSKAFKKYTHAIQYPLGPKSSDYNITVYGSSKNGSNTFKYRAPNERVKEVEVFFKVDDTHNKDPLIVGFICPNWKDRGFSGTSKGCKSIGDQGSKCYYTWTYLTSLKEFSGDIDEKGSISEKELIHGLLEEIGPSISRQQKLVISLEKPDRDQLEYPESGCFKGDKIRVKKDDSDIDGFDKYEHTIQSDEGSAKEFYLSYKRNSRYFMTDTSTSGHNLLASVTAYFERSGDKKLVLITFYLTSEKTYVYSYSDFIKDFDALKNWSTDVKIIKESEAIESPHREVERKLKEESERLRPLIAFNNGSGGGSNEHITTSQESDLGKDTVSKKITFKKLTMTANTSDGPGGGFAAGPWNVYNDYLISREKNMKIEPETELRDIVTKNVTSTTSKKYKSISVYYAITGSRGSEYKALLVEFDPGSTSKAGSSPVGIDDKKYFKRTNKDGTKWAIETIGSFNVDQGKLTQIGINAEIIKVVSSSVGYVNHGIGGHFGSSSSSRIVMTAKPIHIEIETYKKGSYTIGGSGVRVEVTPENPWDKLSMLFKMYRHTIEYTKGSDYKSSQYNISVYSERSGGSGFTLNTPNPKVDAVEVYFRFTDSSNKNPLILGFIYDSSKTGCSTSSSDGIADSGISVTSTGCKGNICYYTWANLANRQYDDTICAYGPISPQDLVTVLLEIGSTVPYRKNQHVVRLNETPRDDVGRDEFKYPDSGHNKEKKITVNKQDLSVSGVVEYDIYEHTFSSSADNDGGVSECYVTYERNSRYFMTYTRANLGLWSGHGSVDSEAGNDKIKSVYAYYEKVTTTGGDSCGSGTATAGNNSKKLVLIAFSFKKNVGELYGYKYSDFIKELKDVRSENRIIDKELKTRVGRTGGSELERILQEESNKLKQITFVKDGDSSSTSGNKHIKTEDRKEIYGQDNVRQGNKFVKVTMIPDLAGGAKDGPWYVYNDHLFTLETDKKIQPKNVLTLIATSTTKNRYHSITVYYSPEGGSSRSGGMEYKYMALLVEFDDYGEKTYIRRLNEQGTKWEKATDIVISGTGDPDGYDKELLPILRQQREKLRPLISFVKGGRADRQGNKHIKTEDRKEIYGQDNVRQGNKFVKVTMTANTSDAPGEPEGVRGSSIGPWRVYNNKLIGHENGAMIPDDVLNRSGILTGNNSISGSNKYKSISVYYTQEDKALLVEFVPGGCGTKKYIKREKAEATKWVIARDVGTGGEVTAKELTQIAREAFGHNGSGSNGASSTATTGSNTDRDSGGDSSISNGTSSSDPVSHSIQGPAGPNGPRVEESEEERALSGGGGGRNDRSNTDDSSITAESRVDHSQSTTSRVGSTDESHVNSSPTSSRTGDIPVVNGHSSPEDSRSDTISSSIPGGGGGGSDDSNTTIGEAVGGGVSLLVAGGGTGFGIYRYRHVFLH